MKQITDRGLSRYKCTTYIFLITLVIAFSAYSCSSYSVREIRDKKKSSKKEVAVDKFELKPLTKAEKKESEKLFSKFSSLGASDTLVGIHLPNMLGSELDSAGNVIVSPDLILNNFSNSISLHNQDDTSSNLSSLLKNTSGPNIPERNMRVNAGFVIRVPKELMDKKSQLVLSPQIKFNNDSVIPFKQVVVRGTDFAAKQAENYKQFSEYEASIVGREDYYDKFLDHSAVNQDIKDSQDENYENYYNDWKKLQEFEKWRENREDQLAYDVAQQVAYRWEKEYEAKRLAAEESERRLAAGKDTVGVYARHMKSFNKKFGDYPNEAYDPKIQLEDVPKKYREIFLSGMTFNDLENKLMTENDSMEIIKNRYKYDAIKVNELRDSLKDERRNLLVPFPYYEQAYVDTIMNGSQDLVVYYPYEIILPQRAMSYTVELSNELNIYGKDKFELRKQQTLPYEFTSLTDLIKPELETKGTKIMRNLFSQITIYPKFDANNRFRIDYKDNRDQIELLKEEYKTYVLEPGYVLDSVIMQTTSSLDGSFVTNWKLSDQRGQTLKKYLAENVFQALNVENMFKHTFKGEDWNTFVVKLRQRDDIVNKDAILERISTIKEIEDTDNAEKDIRRLYKSDYKIMQDSIYPLLRKTTFAFIMHRPGMEVEEEMKYTKIEGYPEALKQMRERRYWDAIKLLSQNPDFNTAICLAEMGENKKAYDLLHFLPEDADNNYLLAIVSCRLGLEDEAIDRLLRACEADKTKLQRIPYDPEMVELIKKHNL